MKQLLIFLAILLFSTASHAGVTYGVAAGPSINANAIQGKFVSQTAPTSGQVMKYNSTSGQWEAVTSDTGDDLGNHTATENINLGAYWLSPDGTDTGIMFSGGSVYLDASATFDDGFTSNGTVTFGSDVTFNSNILMDSNYAFEWSQAGSPNRFYNIYIPTISDDVSLQLPADDGDAGQVLTTDGDGVLSWAAASGGGVASWFAAGFITGANPSLGNTDVATYAEITDSSLTLTPQTGSANIGTVCSTTNAATSPSGSPTTCAAGSEGVGMTFNLPADHSATNGMYEVCFDIEWDAHLDTAETLDVAFTVVETGTANQTVAIDGGPHIAAASNAAASDDSYVTKTVHVCGMFDWSAKSAATQVAVRLFYEQVVGGTPLGSRIFADGLSSLGDRAIRVSAKRL